MSFEVDILEREERYRSRVKRTVVILAVLVGSGLATGLWVRHREAVAARKAAAEAETAAQLAELERLQAAFTADSTAVANRLQDFRIHYEAVSEPGNPVMSVPLPSREPVLGFIRTVWNDYAATIKPDATEEEKRSWFNRYYVDVMNRCWYNSAGTLVWQGEQRPFAVLLPELRQRGLEVEVQKATFPQIVRAQESAGIRVLEPEEMPAGADSVLTQTTGTPAVTP